MAALRIVFLGWALVVSPPTVWLLRETIYEAAAATGWIWMIGLVPTRARRVGLSPTDGGAKR